MSVKDITPESVCAAVLAGHDDVFKLADHFQVMHVSHTLRSTITGLIDAGRLVIVTADERPFFSRLAVT